MEEEKKVKSWKQWYAYWEWKPWKRTDSGKPLKKPWRKKGDTHLQVITVKQEVWQIVNWMSFWKSEITHKDNKKEKVQVKQALTITQACREFGINPQTFWRHLKKFPEANELYQELKAQRRELLKELSEGNIEMGLSWGLDLTGKELMDASFKMLEKTDKAYQPKVEIEQKTISINLHKTTDDIMWELAKVLWTNK